MDNFILKDSIWTITTKDLQVGLFFSLNLPTEEKEFPSFSIFCYNNSNSILEQFKFTQEQYLSFLNYCLNIISKPIDLYPPIDSWQEYYIKPKIAYSNWNKINDSAQKVGKYKNTTESYKSGTRKGNDLYAPNYSILNRNEDITFTKKYYIYNTFKEDKSNIEQLVSFGIDAKYKIPLLILKQSKEGEKESTTFKAIFPCLFSILTEITKSLVFMAQFKPPEIPFVSKDTLCKKLAKPIIIQKYYIKEDIDGKPSIIVKKLD